MTKSKNYRYSIFKYCDFSDCSVVFDAMDIPVFQMQPDYKNIF